MSLALRRRTDPAPVLHSALAVTINCESDPRVMAALQGRSVADMQDRFAEGHRAYVATVETRRAAFGWVATRVASIGELGFAFTIPEGDRYLWNFVTLPEFRGRGIYPLLIEGIIQAEGLSAERFWIAHAPENHASGSGIRKAGFTTVAELSFDAHGRPAVRGLVEPGGIEATRFLGVTEAAQTLTPCWKCVRAGRTSHYCAPDACRCDYQRPDVACH